MKKKIDDLATLRNDFPMMQAKVNGKFLIYLDTAATSQKPYCVIEALKGFYTHRYGTVHRAIYDLAAQASEQIYRVRKRIAAYLHAASPEEIVFTKGTTEGINLIASSCGEAWIRPDDEILITEMEHHANIVPWQRLCAQRGATLRYLPMLESGELDLSHLDRLLTEKTKIVAVAHIANATGTRNPIETIIDAAHRQGAVVLIDGAQAAGHEKVDVQALDADFYVFSGHKMYGPTGVGVLYGKEKWLAMLPPYQCGGDMVETVTMENATFQKPPLKFEAGTPMIAEIVGLGAAIDYLDEIGLDAIHAHEQRLLRKATEALRRIPALRILGQAPHKGPIIQFAVEGVHSLDLGTLLDARGIALRTGHHCAQPTLRAFGLAASSRISFGLYNTEEEIEAFLQSLSDVINLLRG